MNISHLSALRKSPSTMSDWELLRRGLLRTLLFIAAFVALAQTIEAASR